MNIKSLLKQSEIALADTSHKANIYQLKSLVRTLSDTSDIDAIQQKVVRSYKDMTNAIDRCQEFGTVRHSITAQRAAKDLMMEAGSDMVKSTGESVMALINYMRQDGFKNSSDYLHTANKVIKNIGVVAIETGDKDLQKTLEKLVEKYSKVRETIACFQNIHGDNAYNAGKLRHIIAPLALPLIAQAEQNRLPKQPKVKTAKPV